MHGRSCVGGKAAKDLGAKLAASEECSGVLTLFRCKDCSSVPTPAHCTRRRSFGGCGLWSEY